MGCGVCVNNKVYTPIQIKSYKISRLILKTNKLVTEDQINLVKQNLQNSKVILETDPTQQTSQSHITLQSFPLLSQDQRLKMKVLILCRGNDLFAPNIFSMKPIRTHKCYDQIQKDINRTFVEYFNQQHQKNLRIVLLNIALYFPEVGYTQGMNFIVGFFLLSGFNAQETFWMFCHLAVNRKYLIIGMFQDQFPLATLYCKLFYKMLKIKNIQIHDKLHELNIPDQAWLFQWILTYYLYTFQIQKCVKIWQFILMGDGLSILSVALAIVIMLQSKITSLELNYEIFSLFKAANLKELDIEEILRNAEMNQINFNALEQSDLTAAELPFFHLMKDTIIYQQFLVNLEHLRNSYSTD